MATRNVKETPNWAASQTLYLARGEVGYVLLKLSPMGDCEPILSMPSSQSVSIRTFQVGMYTTTTPSFKGARVGAWPDVLKPTASICANQMIWVDIKAEKDAVPGPYSVKLFDAMVNVVVTNFTMPDSPTMPMYMEMGGFVAMQAQGYDRNSQVSIEGPIHQLYNKVLRANRVEPIKQAIISFPTDINTWSAEGGSWKQLVLDGRIAPPCIFGPTGTYGGGGNYPNASLAMVQSLMASGTIPADSWGYIRDEDAAQYDSAIIPIFSQVKSAVPGLRRMMTENRASLDPYVTDPVYDFESWTTVPKPTASQNRSNFWLYGACQSQGSCSNGFQGTPTGSPMMLIDSPGSHQRAYAMVGKLAGARAMLYYNTTQALITAFTNQYLFGGNGDGTLLYPSSGMASPYESVRIKLVRQGMFDAELAGVYAGTIGLRTKLQPLSMTASEQELEELHNTMAKAVGGI